MKLHGIHLTKIVVSVIGVLLSSLLMGMWWSATSCYGAFIFGTVILVWHSKSAREVFSMRSVGFVAVLTLTYTLGYWLFAKIAPSSGPEGDVITLLKAVGIGTFLLPVVHALLLSASWKRVFIAMPCIYVSWYLLGFLLGNRVMEMINPVVAVLILPVAIWQTAYLLFMFAPKPQFREIGTGFQGDRYPRADP